MTPVNRNLGTCYTFLYKKFPIFLKINNQTISKEESILGKIPRSNPEISKRLPPVHRESLHKPKKNSP